MYKNPVLKAAQARSTNSGSTMKIRYQSKPDMSPIGTSDSVTMKLSIPPRTSPSDDSWYMNPRQPNWSASISASEAMKAARTTPVSSKLMASSKSSAMTNGASVAVQVPSAIDQQYVKVARQLGESPAYAPPPVGTKVTGSPYKWSGWF